MSPELKAAADEAIDTAKVGAWWKFTAAIERWWGADATPEAHRALADACCEYAGKRVERHVAAEREACATLVEQCGIVDDLELRKIADLIRARGTTPAQSEHASPGRPANTKVCWGFFSNWMKRHRRAIQTNYLTTEHQAVKRRNRWRHRNRWQTNFAKMKRITGLMVAVRLMRGGA